MKSEENGLGFREVAQDEVVGTDFDPLDLGETQQKEKASSLPSPERNHNKRLRAPEFDATALRAYTIPGRHYIHDQEAAHDLRRLISSSMIHATACLAPSARL